MYELIVERHFSAAHRLRDYEGDCARLHGHNYRVELSIVGQELPPSGMLMDFGHLKALCDQVIGQLDHRCLNDLPPFTQLNATSENLARYIHHRIQEALPHPGLKVGYVRVWETPGQSAVYREA